MSWIRLQCPNRRCRTILTLPPRLFGQTAQCTCCGQMVRVPELPARTAKARSARR